ncbi:MAG: hypothetical protein K0S12_844 [Bacteroidetes bacterium]|nr:hypothetical protein [Bacteroidota bacterium]
MENEKELPVLNAEEVRVLGALIEKSKTTPDYYPMTINALTQPTNVQKASRRIQRRNGSCCGTQPEKPQPCLYSCWRYQPRCKIQTQLHYRLSFIER